jgi:hypothetical protein
MGAPPGIEALPESEPLSFLFKIGRLNRRIFRH